MEILWHYLKDAYGDRFSECWPGAVMGFGFYLFRSAHFILAEISFILNFAIQLLMGGCSVTFFLLLTLVVRDIHKYGIQPFIIRKLKKKEDDNEKRA